MSRSLPPSDDASPATRWQVFTWALYDFGDTAFYVIIMTVGFPLYFKEVVAEGSRNGDLLWGTAFSLSMLIVAIMSPVLGAVADSGAGKKRFLAIFTGLCILATSFLFGVTGGMVAAGMILLVMANVGFQASMVFYDAFLPEISTDRTYGRVSGYGYALGYAGSLATLALVYPLYAGGFAAENLHNIRLSFLISAALFLVFAVPMFFALVDRQRTMRLPRNFIQVGFGRLVETFREFPRYRNVARFLISYFVYIDGVNTIIVFSSIYARETLHFGMTDIVMLFAAIQTSALLGSVLFGILADHAGHKFTLTITLLIWLGLVIAAYFIHDRFTFFMLGIVAGLALGSSQSTSRSLLTEITPAEKKTEFYGFYSFFGKASAIAGPFVFGLISSMLNQRTAILSVGFFIITGLVLLQRVAEPRRQPASD
jgi:UMF1 family MFS transporter